MRLFFSFLLLLSSSLHASNYQWTSSPTATGYHSTPLAACKALAAKGPPNNNIDASRTTASYVSDTRFVCNLFQISNGARYPSNSYRSDRVGTTCDGQYNSSTGECLVAEEPEDLCAPKAGTTQPYSKSGSLDDGYYSYSIPTTPGGKSYGITPGEACMGGCTVAVKSDCRHSIAGNRYTCSGTAYYSGTSCTAGGAPQVETEENYVPSEPENTEIKKPCVYTTDSEGRSVCISQDILDKEGQNCGTYNGESLCVPKEATKDEKTIQTEVKETPTPDGGKVTVKTDVATVTKCSGSKNNCTTTTTTTTTTTKSDGSGTTTESSVTCKGAACGSGTGTGGGGGTGGNGSGGEGECTGDDCEEGLNPPGLDDIPGIGETTQAFYSRVQGSPIMTAIDSIQLPGNGSCNMQSTSTIIGTVSMDSFCQNSHWLDPLYFVFLAIHALAAVRVFLSA